MDVRPEHEGFVKGFAKKYRLNWSKIGTTVTFAPEGNMKKTHATILVIDDSEDDQLLIQHTFKKIGVTDPIHLLSDGVEAIEYMMGEGKFSDRKKYAYPTFIMTDLKMPRKDGFAVLEFLKSNPEWAVIPTIVFSASGDLDDIKKAYMLGASSYHVKPRTPTG